MKKQKSTKKRTNYFVPFFAIAALAGAVAGFAAPRTAYAQTDNTPTTTLPVKAVTLFSSGVSYTLREGEVSGNATVPLAFRTAQINDILKSLVLLDEKGIVQPVVYGAKDPIGRTLSGFAVDVTTPPSRADLLNQLRGAKVTVEAGGTVLAANTQTPKETITGQIVGVESKEVALSPGRTGTVEYLTLLGDEKGLQSVNLDEVKSIRLLDDRLNREFRDALTLLAAGSNDKQRTVALRFDGSGSRRVRVGYVSEAPLWKISYRLLLGGGGISGIAAPGDTSEAKPYLQGWAMVENTTDDDWKNVRLSLVSGRPVSFIQDLYQPLYLPRPVIPPDVVASPYPQLAEGSVEGGGKTKNPMNSTNAIATDADNSPIPEVESLNELRSIIRRPGSLRGDVSKAAPAPAAKTDAFASGSLASNVAAIRSSVTAQASGEKSGELFRYNITTPVSLPRQQAAMIPVIAQDVAGSKVSLYNADTGPRFPLNAFRLKNTTTLHLKGGPVTIFDDGVYAGDARMEDIPPGDSRLITYAVDLAVEGDRQNTGYNQTETSLSIRRGVLFITRKQRYETTYTLKNKADKPRTVLVEHPYRPDFKLVAPEKAAERTGSLYRFSVVVAPNKSETLKVVEEQPISESVGLIGDDLNRILVYVERRDVPEKIKEALREVVTRRRKVQELQNQAASAEAEVVSIDRDQERIRKNMNALDKTSPLYKRYVSQLDAQESRIQSLRTEANRLKSAAAAANRDLQAYLDTLDVTL